MSSQAFAVRQSEPHLVRRILPLAATIVALFVVGILLAIAASGNYAGSDGKSYAFGVGVGVLALTLGMRHAFDADHIAAIDNTTRKLMADGGKRPISVGFFFSLGHSTIVFVAVALLGLGVHALLSQVTDDGSVLESVTGVVGTLVSGVFLWVIAILNVIIAVGIIRTFRGLRSGEFNEAQYEAQLAKRGLMNRIFGRFADRIDKPWKMYPIGVLFGLGFDTSTETLLLVTSAIAAGAGLPWWGVLSLPLLFAAGMCLFDTADGVFMGLAYGWAFMRPARKVYYNVVITVLSVLVAFGIGTIELLGLLSGELGLSGGVWDALNTVSDGEALNSLGFVIVGAFAVTWVVALVVWRLGRFEERWALAPDSI